MSNLGNFIFGNITGVNENVVSNTHSMFEVFMWVIPILGIFYVISIYLQYKSDKKFRQEILSNPKNKEILKDLGDEDELIGDNAT